MCTITNTIETEPEYQRWASQFHSPAYARRTAAKNAAFLMPHLRPGMRLLDAGCGPGSITIGLAEAVAPGETVGIDRSAEAIDAARRRARDAAYDNIRFDVADVYDLPFEDATFDAAFMHAVLQHLDDPARAVREVRRVMKPGGIIALADADWDGTFITPHDPLLDRSFEIMAELRRRTSGNVRVGKHLRQYLHDAGCTRTVASVVGGADGTDEVVRYVGEWQAGQFDAPALIDHLVATGISSHEEIAAVRDAWRRWSEHPAAIWARFWCHALGWT